MIVKPQTQSLVLYVVEDGDGNDLLGCEQEGAASARLAARTLVVLDGEPEARVRRVGDRFTGEVYQLDKRGNLLVRSSDLTRSWR